MKSGCAGNGERQETVICRKGKPLTELLCSGSNFKVSRDLSLDIVLPAVPESVSSARHAVARLLQGAAPMPIVVYEDVLLLVSELVTNAVLHARTDARVTAAVHDGRITVAVGDDDPHHAPVVADRGAMATNGRGVMLVDTLASSWGVDLRDDSKVVWFEALFETGLAGPGGSGPRTTARLG